MISFNQFKNQPRVKDLSPSEQNRQYFIYYSNQMLESSNIISPAAAAAAAAAGSGGGALPQNNSLFLAKALAGLNSRYSEVTSLVPDLYKFWDDIDGGGTGINDGGDDMYDGANFMNTNLTQLWDDITTNDQDDYLCIPYTHTQAGNEDDYPNEYFEPPMDGSIASSDSYFGPNSQYFTNMYPGLFIMAADKISISEFTVCGNLGSDGNGVGAGIVEDVVPGWTLFLKTNTDAGDDPDPTVNHLILVPGSSAGITHDFDTSSSYDDHGIFGIADRNKIIFAVVARFPETYDGTSEVLSESDAILVAQKILEIVL